jgi:hypothetical protein
MLLAFAVVINMFSITVPIAGAPVFRIRFGGPFLKFIALLFGGIYGGIAGALSDLISFILKPEGGYLWPLTIVEFLKGLAIGLIWFKLKDSEVKNFRLAYGLVMTAVTVLGICNFTMLKVFPSSAYALFLGNIGKTVYFSSIGLIFAGILGLLPLPFIGRFRQGDLFLKIFATIVAPCLIGTIINTVILKYFMLLPDRAFGFLLIPRLAEEVIQILFNSYIVVILFNSYSVKNTVKAYEKH